MFLKQMACNESKGAVPAASLGSAQGGLFIVPRSRRWGETICDSQRIVSSAQGSWRSKVPGGGVLRPPEVDFFRHVAGPAAVPRKRNFNAGALIACEAECTVFSDQFSFRTLRRERDAISQSTAPNAADTSSSIIRPQRRINSAGKHFRLRSTKRTS
jgi:hypothetical protein